VFRGRFEHNLDDKGRVAVPSRFREVLFDRTSEPTVVITNFDRCLAAYPLAEWESLEQKLAAMPQFDPNVVAFTRYFISGATECPVDKAGRILVPAGLRQFAGIDRDCIIAGQIKKFEIWSSERWNSEFNGMSDQFSRLSAALAPLGIQL